MERREEEERRSGALLGDEVIRALPWCSTVLSDYGSTAIVLHCIVFPPRNTSVSLSVEKV